jgi:hypothetical protein
MKLPEIIGWPGSLSGKPHENAPSGSEMEESIKRTMPIARIYPCEQHSSIGLEIFSVDKAWKNYVTYLKKNNITPANDGPFLEIIYLDISPFGESYSNSYSPSVVLQGLQEGIGGATAEAIYFSGRTGKENIEALAKQEGLVGVLGQGILNIGKSATKMAKNIVGPGREGLVNEISNALTKGGRLDFPMMWRGSSYQAQYDVTIRLYCPNVNNQDNYETLIVAPLGALMALSLPRTETDLTFTWPFLVQFEVPGLVNLEAGFVSNMSVIKCGDVNDRSWNGFPNMVDVRLSINSLYNTALLSKGKLDSKSRIQTVFNEMNFLKKPLTPKTTYDINSGIYTESGGGGTVTSGPQVPPSNINTNPPSTHNNPSPQQADAIAAMPH